MPAFFKKNLRINIYIRKNFLEKEVIIIKKTKVPTFESKRYVYRASIKLKNGKVIFAKAYGKRAFRIPVEDIA